MNTPQENQRKLSSLLRGEAVDGAFVRELRESYPFFTLPDALMLRRSAEADMPLPEGEERQRIMARLALNSCDAAAAERLARGEDGAVEAFYPPLPEEANPTTESAIDTFLSSYGSRSEEEDALLERLIFNPVPDYALTLEEEEASSEPERPAPATEPVQAAAKPVLVETEKTEAPKPAAEAKAAEAGGNRELLSESLAKIFIKTRRYGKACEILERLSLEFPQKSRYFADQLRFLRKLILIEERREERRNRQSE